MGRGVLREAIADCTRGGFAVADISTRRLESDQDERGAVAVRLELQGTGHTDELVAELGERDGVLAVDVERPGDE